MLGIAVSTKDEPGFFGLSLSYRDAYLAAPGASPPRRGKRVLARWAGSNRPCPSPVLRQR
jgi:hypothetical protein